MSSAVLAELEIFHTRPAVATRRVSLGHLILPVEPAPGLGGLLLGAVVAHHVVSLDADMQHGVVKLIHEIEDGRRIVQPRLRHRFQVDRHGLAVSRHTLVGADDEIGFEFGTTGSDLAQVLGAVYALERVDATARHTIAPLMRKAVRWRGPIGPGLIAHLAGSQSTALSALADPRTWALELLGFEPGAEPSKREITRAFRNAMREAHPDHGGDADDASKMVLDLTEARAVLTAKP